MRVPDNLMTNRVITQLNSVTDQISKLQIQISSGVRIQRPSDDPGGALRASNLRSGISLIENHQSVVKDSQQWLKSEDSALGSIQDTLRQIRNLGLQAGNTMDQPARDALKAQVDTLTKTLVQSANSTDGLRYVFAGYQSTQPPFTDDGVTVQYNGDYGKKNVTIIDGVTLELNHDGQEVFNAHAASDPSTPSGPDVFTTVRNLSSAIQSGNMTSINTYMAELDDHISRVGTIRVETGTRLQQTELAGSRLEQSTEVLNSMLSDTEGTDLAEALVHLQEQQNLYQAATYVGSTLARAGLLDWIR